MREPPGGGRRHRRRWDLVQITRHRAPLLRRGIVPVGWCGWKIPAKRIMASCHFFRSWMAWQLIRHLCPPLYRRYSPDLDLPGGLANPFDVFEALLTYKNYDRGHFVTFVVWMTSHYSAGCCWRCYRQMRKAYPWAIPTWHALLRQRLWLFLLRP